MRPPEILPLPHPGSPQGRLIGAETILCACGKPALYRVSTIPFEAYGALMQCADCSTNRAAGPCWVYELPWPGAFAFGILISTEGW